MIFMRSVRRRVGFRRRDGVIAVVTAGLSVLMKDPVHLDVGTAGLTVLSRVGPDSSRVIVCGEVDVATAAALRHVIDHVLASGPPRMDADVAAMAFIDAAGIRVFESAGQRCRLRGGRLRLEQPSAQLRRLLAMVGCANLLLGE